MENAINSIEISSLFLMQKQQQTPKTEEDKPVCFIIEGLELATSDMVSCFFYILFGRDIVVLK